MAGFPSKLTRIIYFDIVPIKDNRLLVIGKGTDESHACDNSDTLLCLSMHEVRSCRLGPALWTYYGPSQLNNHPLRPMKSTTNALGITFGVDYESHMELFDISTEADFPLIEAGRFNYDKPLNGARSVELSPDRSILLKGRWDNQTVKLFYSGSGDTNNRNFSFVTHVPIPNPNDSKRTTRGVRKRPSLKFSNDGSKFAVATDDGVVSVWDVRSKLPLKVFNTVEKPTPGLWQAGFISFLQFSSGLIWGREVLVFMERKGSGLPVIHLMDTTSLETEEIPCLPTINNDDNDDSIGGADARGLFFDPSGGSMYAEIDGMLYEWDLRKDEGPEWWLGKE